MTEFSPNEVLSKLPARVSDAVEEWAKRTPDQLALVETGGSWTYAQLSQAMARTRELAKEWGVRPGDRVMIVCENSRTFAALYLGLAGMDVWPALVNAKLSPQEVDQIEEHCGARRVLYTAGASIHAMKHANRREAEIREIAELGKVGIGKLNEEVTPEPVDTDPGRNVAALIYTSGTTGKPKGVMLTHRGILFVARMSAVVRHVTQRERFLGVLPMSHAVGLCAVMMGALAAGATLYVSTRFDPVALLNSLERDGITLILGAPSLYALMVEYAKLKKLNGLHFPSLRLISSSGAPLSLQLKQDTEALLGVPLGNGYGVTEFAPTMSFTRMEEPRKDLSVGKFLPGVEHRLVDAQGKEVPEGMDGELHARGPNLMRGYYRAPEETAAAIDADGWFNTRDLARIENGQLYIVGRTKELIVRFGFNVYPAEVEAVLGMHPGVARAAVIGRTINGEEEVIAFVEPREGMSVSEEEIAKHAAGNLAPYKHPSRIVLLKEMPLTPTGKPKKDELAKMLASGGHAN